MEFSSLELELISQALRTAIRAEVDKDFVSYSFDAESRDLVNSLALVRTRILINKVAN